MERVDESTLASDEDVTQSEVSSGEGAASALKVVASLNESAVFMVQSDGASNEIPASVVESDESLNQSDASSISIAAPHPATFTRPLAELKARLGAPVSDALLFLAMTHPSAVGEGIERTLLSNQRLEFLGDSLVGAICAEYFFRIEPQSPEGALTNRKISAVRKDALASAAKRLELGKYLTFGRGEDVAGGRDRHSNLSDAFEALIAAIFLSNDWNTTRDWVLLALQEELNKDPATLVPAKNRLQERTQAMGLGIPRYAIMQSHPKAQWFAASVFVGDEMRGQGEGKSKKLAEENAAKMALDALDA